MKTISLLTIILLFPIIAKCQYASSNEIPEILTTFAVGNTPSNSSVGSDGSGLINIPIQLPDGTAGKKPTLSLAYSSNGGSGNLGIGWNIAGISAITRGDKQKFLDGNSNRMGNVLTDPYYLDGQRLILDPNGPSYGQNGSLFRTRIDNHEKITVYTSNNGSPTGPDYFIVEKPDGISYEYGADIQVGLYHPDGTKLTWPLTRITDCQGNYIEYIYEVADQEILLKEIRYTGNDDDGIIPFNKIKFNYANSDFEQNTYINGEIAYKRKKLLTEISIESEGNIYKRYLLEYLKSHGQDILFSVQECGSNTCLNPIYIEYTNNALYSSYSDPTNIDLTNAYDRYYSAELDQDGFDDLIRIRYSCNNGVCTINNYQIKTNDPNNPGTFTNPTTQSLNLPTEDFYFAGSQYNGFSLAEFNGDGISDFAILSTLKTTINTNSQYVYKQNDIYLRHSPIVNNSYSETNFEINGYDYIPEPVKYYKWNNVLTGDFDGDSKTDILTIHYNGDEDVIDQIYNVRMHSGGGVLPADRNRIVQNTINGSEIPWNSIEKIQVIDYDGNGDSELLVVTNTSGSGSTFVLDYTFNANNSQWEIEVVHVSGTIQPSDDFMIGDFNADRISDILITTNGTMTISFGRANGLYNSGYIQSNWSQSLPTSLLSVLVMDVNADGFDDILVNHSVDDLKIYVNRRAKFNGSSSAYEQFFLPDDFEDFGDISRNVIGNFQGTSVNSIIKKNGFQGSHRLVQFSETGQPKVKRIRDSFGNESKFEYECLSKGATSGSDLYTIGTGSVFPVNDIHYSIRVVSEHTIPDGLDGEITQSYAYSGAKLHRQGLGLLGFEEMYVSTSNNNLRTVHLSELDVPSMAMRLKSTYLEDVSGNLTAQAQILGNKIRETKYEYTYHFHSNALYHYSIDLTKVWTLDYLIGSETYSQTSFGWDGAPTSSFQDIGRSFNGQNYSGISQISTIYESYNTLCNGLHGLAQEKYTYYSRQNQPSATYSEKITQNPSSGNITETRKFYQKPKEITTTYTNFLLGLPQTTTVSAANLTTRTNQTEYDSKGRWIVNSTNAMGQTQSNDDSYDIPHSKIKTDYDLTGLNITYIYDEFHRIIKATNSLGNETIYTYSWENGTGNGSSTSSADNAIYSLTINQTGKATNTNYYDRHGQLRMTETEGFENSQVINRVLKYDQFGRVEVETQPFDNFSSSICTTTYVYDDMDRIISQTTSGVGTTTREYTYDPLMYIVTVEDPAGEERITKTDATGQIIEVTDNGGTLSYTYNALNLLVETKVGAEILSTIEYDDYGRKKTLIDPSSGTTNYVYNAFGELEQQVTGNGSFPSTFTYDQLGRITTKTDNSGVTTYQYVASGNGLNQIQSISALGELKNYSYDAYNRISMVNYPTQNVSQEYTYNSIGQLRSRKINGDQEFIYTFNNDGYLFKKESKASYESNATAIHQTIKVNPFGRTTQFQAVGATVMDKTRNIRNKPTFINFGNLYGEEYFWDETSGNLEQRDNLYGFNPSEEFEYDNLNRLTKATIDNTVACSTEYTALGNCTTNLYAVGDIEYGNSQYQAGMVINNPQNISLDTREITYTAFNEPASIKEGDYEIIFTYGVSQTRIKSELFFLNQLVETRTYFPEIGYETTTNHQTNRKYHLYYEYTDGVISSMVVQEENLNTNTIITQQGEGYYSVVSDYLGSILRVFDKNDIMVAEQSFSAWGRYRNPDDWTFTTSSFTNPDWLIRGYTGHEQLDQFALIHMNGRLYCPLTTRMLSPDNFVQDPYSTQSYNRYSYVWNNPMRYTDPSGEFTWEDGVAIGMIGVGAALILTSPLVAAGSLGAAAPVSAAMATVGVGLVMGGITHFAQTANQAQNPGTSWNQASAQTGLTFGISINFGATTGPTKSNSSASQSAGTYTQSDYERAVIAANGYEQSSDQYSQSQGPQWSVGGMMYEVSDPTDGMVFMDQDQGGRGAWDLNGDGIFQKNEADNWWLQGNGAVVYVDNSKIDWSGLTIPKGKRRGDKFAISTTDAFKKLPYETAATYGGTSFFVFSSSKVMVLEQTYHYNYRDNNSVENVLRNGATWWGKPSEQGTDFLIQYKFPIIDIK